MINVPYSALQILIIKVSLAEETNLIKRSAKGCWAFLGSKLPVIREV
jgi:hypothetical protein